MTKLEKALAWWPAVLRYGGFVFMSGSFLLYVTTSVAYRPAVEVPTQFLLSFGAMMAIGETGKTIQGLARTPSSPPVPGQQTKEE